MSSLLNYSSVDNSIASTAIKHTISILVENHAGVLSRISGLFSRRGFNIDSLAVGITDNPNVSRITIVVNGDDYTVEQVEKQLNKLIDVIKLRRLQNDCTINRELLLVKVAYNESNLCELRELLESANANICDISASEMILEVCDTSEKLSILCKELSAYHILELVRTGVVALEKNNIISL